MKRKYLHSICLAGALLPSTLAFSPAWAAVSVDEAAKLKTTLTPLGGERAGNADGSIPAWTGGMVSDPTYKAGGRRDHLFAGEKPLFSITSANLGQYADKLTEGTKAMFAKYPDSYRIDVYKTQRTAAAPDWVYANTFSNATRVKIIESPSGLIPAGAYGGLPFPVPKQGIEVLWNHLLAWRGSDWQFDIHGYLGTADGKRVLTVDAIGDQTMPYYQKDGSPETFKGKYWAIRLINSGPPIRAGEAITGLQAINDDETTAWVYLTGQRRTRKLPNPCCDTPTPATAGVMSFDEINIFGGRTNRFDWTLVGKKEMYVPYNTNQAFKGTDGDLLGAHHLNPDAVRWELHRVWVVDAALKSGQRHVAPKGRYYFDEDTGWGMLAERWDSNGQLWKVLWELPFAAPDIPASVPETFGFYDLVSGAWFANAVMNEKASQYTLMPHYSDATFTPDAMSGEGIR